jgi:chromosomal replication initiation ATPase DnaA
MTRTQKALIRRLDSIGLFPIEVIKIKALPQRAVIKLAADWAGITIDDLLSKSRLSDVAACRWLVIYALRCRYRWLSSLGYSDWCNYYSLSALSRSLDMHHTTIMYAMKSTIDVMQTHRPELYDFYFGQPRDKKVWFRLI